MARWLLIALALASCSRASDQSEAKQWQGPPPNEIGVPAGLSIGVQVDGSDAPPITSAVLTATKPDFVDAEHRAWRIPTLVKAAAPIGTIVEAAAPTGVAVKFAPGSDGLEPVLFLTRRGEVIVAALD